MALLCGAVGNKGGDGKWVDYPKIFSQKIA